MPSHSAAINLFCPSLTNECVSPVAARFLDEPATANTASNGGFSRISTIE